MKYSWTEERIDLLTKLRADGDSSTEIGKKVTMLSPFNMITRNAVVGKAFRLRLPYHPEMRKVARSRPRRRDHKPHLRPKPGQPSRLYSFFSKLPIEPMPAPSGIDIARVSFNELDRGHCRWPVADVQECGQDKPLYCGDERIPGLPYCANHARRAYQTIAPRIIAQTSCPTNSQVRETEKV